MRAALYNGPRAIEVGRRPDVGLRGGVAPSRAYIPELLDDALEAASIKAASSTSIRILTVSPKRMPRWTSAGRSSPCCG